MEQVKVKDLRKNWLQGSSKNVNKPSFDWNYLINLIGGTIVLLGLKYLFGFEFAVLFGISVSVALLNNILKK